MLRLAIRRVGPRQLELLREGLREVDGRRRQEALATLADEGCTHEMAVLVPGTDGPMLVQVMEVEEVERSIQAAAGSPHLIDTDHRRVLGAALREAVASELLLDLHP